MRRGWAAVVLGLAMLAPQASLASPPAARPDIAQCPPLAPLAEPLNDRTKPLAVPKSFAMLVRADAEQFAVATIYGGTVCVDVRGMTGVSTFTLSTDRRFLEFDWTGYEADGHIVVDRTGAGQVLDTGVSPVSSPSGRRFAAVQQSEAAFGALEGFGVWQIGVVGVRRLALQEDIPSLVDWRIDSWKGDDCIDLSGIPHERIPGPRARLAKLPRDRYVAVPVGSGWILTRSAGGCAAAQAGK